jgi:hypothetical protein
MQRLVYHLTLCSDGTVTSHTGPAWRYRRVTLKWERCYVQGHVNPLTLSSDETVGCTLDCAAAGEAGMSGCHEQKSRPSRAAAAREPPWQANSCLLHVLWGERMAWPRLDIGEELPRCFSSLLLLPLNCSQPPQYGNTVRAGQSVHLSLPHKTNRLFLLPKYVITWNSALLTLS